MKLCTCNNCGLIWQDPNPPVDAKEYPENPFIKPLEKVYEEVESDNDRKNKIMGCPVCETDAYLSDEVDENKLAEVEQRFIEWATIWHGQHHDKSSHPGCEVYKQLRLYSDQKATMMNVYNAVLDEDDTWESSLFYYFKSKSVCIEMNL